MNGTLLVRGRSRNGACSCGAFALWCESQADVQIGHLVSEVDQSPFPASAHVGCDT